MAKTTVLRGKLYLKEVALALGDNNPILTVDSTTGEVTLKNPLPSSSILSSVLPTANIYVGNMANVATPVAVTGDISLSHTGNVNINSNVINNSHVSPTAGIVYSKLNLTNSIVNADISPTAGIVYSKLNLTNSIVNSDISPSANIARSKLATGNPFRVLVNNAAGTISENVALAPNFAVVTDSNGLLTVSSVTTSELNYVSGVTSNIQAQLLNNILGLPASVIAKNPDATVHLWSIVWDNNAGEWTLLNPTAAGLPAGGATGQFLRKTSGNDYDVYWGDVVLSDITDIVASSADLNLLSNTASAGLTTTQLLYLVGVTSNIQVQLNNKQDRSLAHNAIWVGNASNIATQLPTGPNGYVLTSVNGVPQWQPNTGGGGGGHIIQNSGSSLPQRTYLNFTNGLTASDDLVNDASVVVLGGDLTNTVTFTGSFGVHFYNSLVRVSSLRLRSSSGNFEYVFVPANISSDVNVDLPDLTSNDTFVFQNYSQTLTNKVLGSNTGVSIGSDATGDIYYRGSSGLLTRLPDVAVGNVLLSGGVGQPPAYGKVTSSHVDSTIQLSGLSWLLASGGVLTGDNTISGSFNIGFTNTAVGVGLAPGSIPSGTKFLVRGFGSATDNIILLQDNDGNNRFSVTDEGRVFIHTTPNDAVSGHQLLLRDNTSASITKLGIGTGLSISSGNLQITSGYAWLLASGGALSGPNTISGSHNIGFTNNAIGVGVGPASITTNVRLDIRGIGTTSATSAVRVADGSNNELLRSFDDGEWIFKEPLGAMLMRILPTKIVEVGGTSSVIRVPSTIPSGAARIEFRDNVVLAYILGTNSSNFLEFRSTTGDHRITIRKTYYFSDNQSIVAHINYEAVVPNTADATTTIASFPVTVGTEVNVESSWLISASDGNGGGAHVTATIKNIGGNTTMIGSQSKQSRFDIGNPSVDIVANNTNDTIDFNFTNASAPNNRAYKVNISVRLHITDIAT